VNDLKLISFKYFFMCKFFLVCEVQVMVFLLGGFGICDEVFEVLMLI